MARKAFAFALGQRVNVPGHPGVQGVIGLPFASAEIDPQAIPLNPDVPIWFVRWLAVDGKVWCRWCPEPELAAAQAPPDAPESSDLVVSGPGIETGIPLNEYTGAETSKRKPARRRKTKR